MNVRRFTDLIARLIERITGKSSKNGWEWIQTATRNGMAEAMDDIRD